MDSAVFADKPIGSPFVIAMGQAMGRILLVMISLLTASFGQQQSAVALINQGNELRANKDPELAEKRYLAATQGAGVSGGRKSL